MSKGLVLSWKRWRQNRWENDRQVILDFNRSLLLFADPDALMASISSRLRELFSPDCVIILRAVDAGIFTLVFSSGCEAGDLKNIQLTQRDRLTKWLQTNEASFFVGQDPGLFEYLSATERDMLRTLDVKVCVPLLAMSRLSGIVMLCSRDPEWKLDADHAALLEMLASQASVAFENTFLRQQQQDRLQRLYRAERLVAVGQLAASTAHEIRNPLTIIRSTIQYVLSEFEPPHPKRELVEGLIDEVDRIDRTLDGLLSLTRKQVGEPHRVQLGQLIHQTVLLIRSQAASQQIEIVWEMPSVELFIMGDSQQLKQLFLNLLLNAFQAMPGGGRIRIDLDAKVISTGNAEGFWAQLLFADTGCGISEDNLEKIFDPFFTTKPGGTGLGLSTSYAIAQQHGGVLEITSQVEVGTTVLVRFPIVS